MPYTIKPGSFKYKKSNGQFSEIDCFEGPDLTEEVAALEKGKAPIIIDSATGNPIVIKDGADGLPVEGMKIHFSPIQSGTGDPSPSNIRPISGWNNFILNRTGANVFNANEWIGMGVNSTKYSIGENCTITVKENDTSSIGNRLITLIPNTVYAYYADNSFSDIRVFNSSGSSIESKSTQTFTAPADGKVAIKFYASTYPTTGQFSMVIGSTPPVACIPYAKNFHLITVPALGKNLCPKLIKGIGINANDGSEMQIATFATTDYIPVDFSKDHEYSLSGLEIQLTSYISAYNAQKQFIGRTSGTQRANDHLNEASFPNGTDKATGDIAFLRISQYEGTTNKSIDLIDNINVQLEVGSSVTTYEPYINNTVYGGTLDAVTGVLTIDKKAFNLGALGWVYADTTNYRLWYADNDEMDAESTDLICEKYMPANDNSTNNSIRKYITGSGVKRVSIHDDEYNEYTTSAQIKTALNDVYYVSKIGNPYEIQLDPVTVTTLLGDNTIWSDANGNIELDYRADTKLFCQKNDQVNDVQINGTSILNNGVANVPLSNTSTPGVAYSSGNYGINVNSNNGEMSIKCAGLARVKAGTNAYDPIVASHQHESVFYGLAKLAGADMSSSSNAIGTFTPEAIVAIQKMLGVYQAPWELIREDTFTNETEADHVITVDGNGLAFELTDVVLQFETPTQETDAAKAYYGIVNFYYTSDYFISTEAKAWTQTANSSPHGFTCIIENKDGMVFAGTSQQTTTGNASSYLYRYGVGFPLSVGIGLPNSAVSFSKINIRAVTGTGHYKLFGRRKWTT